MTKYFGDFFYLFLAYQAFLENNETKVMRQLVQTKL